MKFNVLLDNAGNFTKNEKLIGSTFYCLEDIFLLKYVLDQKDLKPILNKNNSGIKNPVAF